MYKAYKFRIYPNDEQRILLNKSFGCFRFVYNYYLNEITNKKDGTINGASALGYGNIGCIKEGNIADIIILDISDICLYPVPDLISLVVHNCYFDCVDTTIVDGKVLMENKKILLDIDIDKLKDKVRGILNRVNS